MTLRDIPIACVAWCLILIAMQRVPCARADARVIVDLSRSLSEVSATAFGFDESLDQSISDPAIRSDLASLHAGIIRWPGGGNDSYHWRSSAMGPGICARGTGTVSYDFDEFMTNLALPLGAQVAIGVNYGSNASCDGPGDPREAAAWVEYANRVKRYDVKLWTIGNEQWAPWALDLHAPAHDAITYASEVAHSYYPLMKAADPTISIGVGLGAPEAGARAWDRIVLARAKYDFVEVHLYPEKVPHSDAWLLRSEPAAIARAIAITRSELRAAGRPNAPIFIGEWNSAGFDLDKQSTSPVEALFVAMAQGEILNAGVRYAAFFDGYSIGCAPSRHDDALAGSLSYGTWSLFSAGEQTWTGEGGCAPGTRFAPRASAYPAAHALRLVRRFAGPGDRMVMASVAGQSDVRVYAVARDRGYAVMLVNTNRTRTARCAMIVRGSDSTVVAQRRFVYDPVQYDTWSGPREEAAPASGDGTVTLAPWSITLLEFDENG